MVVDGRLWYAEVSSVVGSLLSVVLVLIVVVTLVFGVCGHPCGFLPFSILGCTISILPLQFYFDDVGVGCYNLPSSTVN